MTRPTDQNRFCKLGSRAVSPSAGAGSVCDSPRSPPSPFHFLRGHEGGRCNQSESCRQNSDITDQVTTHPIMPCSMFVHGELPVEQVRQDGAAQELDGPVQARRSRAAPQRRPAHRGRGDGTVGGRSLRRRHTTRQNQNLNQDRFISSVQHFTGLSIQIQDS